MLPVASPSRPTIFLCKSTTKYFKLRIGRNIFDTEPVVCALLRLSDISIKKGFLLRFRLRDTLLAALLPFSSTIAINAKQLARALEVQGLVNLCVSGFQTSYCRFYYRSLTQNKNYKALLRNKQNSVNFLESALCSKPPLVNV